MGSDGRHRVPGWGTTKSGQTQVRLTAGGGGGVTVLYFSSITMSFSNIPVTSIGGMIMPLNGVPSVLQWSIPLAVPTVCAMK